MLMMCRVPGCTWYNAETQGLCSGHAAEERTPAGIRKPAMDDPYGRGFHDGQERARQVFMLILNESIAGEPEGSIIRRVVETIQDALASYSVPQPGVPGLG